MPCSITHTYIGLDTLKKVHQKPQYIIKKHLNNYKIYCQSMDVLYFYHILLLKNNTTQKLGHDFHNKNSFNSFKMLIDDNKMNKDEELFTFISGLITHYKADSIMHPYIDYLAHSTKKIKEIDKHFEIETYIDNYFVNKNEDINFKKYNSSKHIFNYTKKTIVQKEIDKIFKQFFSYNNMGNKYYKALNEMRFVFKHIRTDKLGLKKMLYKFIDINPFNIRRCKYLSYHFELDNNAYFLNLSHKTWFNYKNKKIVSNKSFLDLYGDVIKEASYIINELYCYIFENKEVDLYKLIGNISYSTGLPLA
jgi:hypothetical protein